MPKGKMGFQPGNQVAKLADHSNRRRDRFVTREIVAQLNDKHNTNETNLVAMVRALIKNAVGGDVSAFNAIIERVEGKVPLPVEGRVQHHHFDLTRLSDAQLEKLGEALETAMVIEGTAEEVLPDQKRVEQK